MKALILLLSGLLAVTASAAQLTVHAASSLTDVLKEIVPAYEQRSGAKVRLNFDASSILARQIEEGAPGDIFLSADEAKMDDLEKNGLIVPGTRRTFLSNRLVVVVPSDSHLKITSARSLTSPAVAKIAVAQPSTVPAGIYTREFLTRAGLWDALARKIVPTQNVRAALAAVESGNVEAGFVYKTDALISKKVKVALEIPAAAGPQISYPAAVLRSAVDRQAAQQFLTYLASPVSLAVFRKYGFSIAAGVSH